MQYWTLDKVLDQGSNFQLWYFLKRTLSSKGELTFNDFVELRRFVGLNYRKPRMLILFLLSFSLYSCSNGQPQLTGYENMVNLTNEMSPDGVTSVPTYYVYYYTVNETVLQVGTVCDSPGGWCAFGFSPDGTMPGSDVGVGYVDTGNNGFTLDFTIGNRFPPVSPCDVTSRVCPDTSGTGCANNLAMKSASRQGNYLIFEYSRPTKASDTCDREVMINTPIPVIFSLGNVVTGASFPFNMIKHAVRTNTINGSYFMQFNTAPSTSGSNSGTTGKPSGETTGKSSATTSVRSSTTHSATASGCASNLQQLCSQLCGINPVKDCTCVEGLPNAVCEQSTISTGSSTSAIWAAFHVVLALILFAF